MLKFLAWTGLVFGTISATHAEGRLQATLVQSDSAHPTRLVFTLANIGDKPVAFERFNTPLQLLNGVHTSLVQFDVQDDSTPDHVQADYRGYSVHTIGHPVENFMTLNPGQTESATYDLDPDFELVPGKTYAVTFRMMVGLGPVDGRGVELPSNLRIPRRQEIRSNTVMVSVPKTPSAAVMQGRPAVAAVTNPVVSDPKKLDALDKAVRYGYLYMANPAWVHYDNGRPPFGDANAKGSVHSDQYKAWFGTYNNNDANDKLVTGTLSAIADRLNQGLHGTAIHKLKFVEACPSGTPASTQAIAHDGSVKAEGVYEIVLCDSFWAAPAKPAAGDLDNSQPQTLVHEVSHFADLPTDALGWTNKTSDWSGYAYFRPACKQLVQDNRAKAVASASNFEYFIRDVMQYY